MVFFINFDSEKILFMKKIIVVIIILYTGMNAFAHENAKYQSALAKRIKFYPLYFNTLQLTPEQRSELEYIIDKYNNDYKNNLDNINYLKTLSLNEEKEIKKILDKRQKAQFRILKHLEKQDIKRSFKEKNYYKLNPRMSVFGDLPKK